MDNPKKTASRDTVSSAVTNQLKKTILKLVFSYGGIDPEIDAEIARLKEKLRTARNEGERRPIIEASVDEILRHSDKLRLGLKGEDTPDYFITFLERLALPGSAGKELIFLRQKARELKQQKEYLKLIDQAIDLICSSTDPEEENRLHLIHLLEQLTLPKEASVMLMRVRDQLSTREYSSLKEMNVRISDIINKVNSELQAEMDDIRLYLNRLIGQLSVLYGYLQSSQREQGISCIEAENLNRDFLKETEAMQNEINAACDLETLKSQINSHMDKIKCSLRDHLVAEQQRKKANEERVSELKGRLQAMEKETLGLKEKLNDEHNNAHHDMLTTIPNRLAYDIQIKKEIARSHRYQKPMSLAVIDIDAFKKINDKFGHRAGDKVLKAVAAVCRENIRDTDFLARYGGEEFVLILPETDVDEAAIAVENLRRVVESCNFYHQNQSVTVTISIGYAELRSNDDEATLFNRADMAMYTAKENGRNQCISEVQVESAA